MTEPSISGARDRDADTIPRVSVIVAARNGAAFLPFLFNALSQQTAPSTCFELIVVDDGSDDETAELVRSCAFARLVQPSGHVGLPAARNLGIREARGQIVALTDADCIPEPTWVMDGLASFASDEVDMIAGGITVPLGERPSIATLLDSSRFFDQERAIERGFGISGPTSGCDEGVRTRRMFNEQLAAYGGDDDDFGQRATAAGSRLAYAPDVNVFHPPRQRGRDLARKAYRLGYSMAAQRRVAGGMPRGAPRLFLNWKMWLPRRRIYRVERLNDRGVYPGRREQALLLAGQYLYVQMPRVAGDRHRPVGASAPGANGVTLPMTSVPERLRRELGRVLESVIPADSPVALLDFPTHSRTLGTTPSGWVRWPICAGRREPWSTARPLGLLCRTDR